MREGVADFVNLNGIVATTDGKYLIVAQTNTATLFRISIADKSIIPINLGGEPMPGDGLLLDHQTLYAVRFGSQIATMTLASDFASGQLVGTYTNPSFKLPTALAMAGGCILVTNAQLDKQIAQQPPELPFTITNVPLATIDQAAPPAKLPQTGATSQPALWLLGTIGLLATLIGLFGFFRLRRIG